MVLFTLVDLLQLQWHCVRASLQNSENLSWKDA